MRRKTTAVRIGNVVLSSEEPVLVQSMLNTSTRDYRGRWPAGEDYCSGSEGSGDARGNTPSFA